MAGVDVCSDVYREAFFQFILYNKYFLTVRLFLLEFCEFIIYCIFLC
jgi:hypothetical protein